MKKEILTDKEEIIKEAKTFGQLLSSHYQIIVIVITIFTSGYVYNSQLKKEINNIVRPIVKEQFEIINDSLDAIKDSIHNQNQVLYYFYSEFKKSEIRDTIINNKIDRYMFENAKSTKLQIKILKDIQLKSRYFYIDDSKKNLNLEWRRRWVN